MTRSATRPLNFTWPVPDVSYVRRQYIAARRVYRQPAPEALNLTISAFTETAYTVARDRKLSWNWMASATAAAENQVPREVLSITWTIATAAALDDDWDDLTELALREEYRTGAPTGASRLRMRKSEVARLGVLNGLDDWQTWVRTCPNDPRRGAR